MIQDQEYKEFIDIFYSGINRYRREYSLDILSEDQCIPNQLLEQVLKGQSKESDDKRAIYKRCQLFCDEKDFIFNKQHLQMNNSYSITMQDVEEGIKFMFNQIYQDNQKELQSNKKLTHMKIFILKSQTDILRTCLALTAKPIQIVEFSYDTLLDSYIIQGKLNKYISKEPINLYAIKIIDSYNLKETVIGPGRGQIDEKLNFIFKIPQSLLKDCGIQPSNNRCELEFFHKIEAEISHYQHFAFTSVDIDHTYSLIMKQSFIPVQNGRFSARKARKDSPDIRRSNSLFKNRLSSSCNKENRLPGQGMAQENNRLNNSMQYENNPMSDQFFTQNNNNNNQGYNYFSEQRNNARKSPFMDSIWEANEKEFSIYKDDEFKSANRRGKDNYNSQSKNKQIFSFGENDANFFSDNPNSRYSKQNEFQQQDQQYQFRENRELFTANKSQQMISQSVQNNNIQSSNKLFQNPQNNIFIQTPFNNSSSQPIGVTSSQNSIQNIQNPFFSNKNNSNSNINNAANLFANVNNTQNTNIFANPSTSEKNIFSFDKNNNNMSNNSKGNDIWNTSKKDLFQNQPKQDNISLQNPILLSTNLFQTNTNNNANSNTNNINNNINNNQFNNNNNIPIVQNNSIFQNQQSSSSQEPINIFQNGSNTNQQISQSINNTNNNSVNLLQQQLNSIPVVNLTNNSIRDIPLVNQSLTQQANQTGILNQNVLGKNSMKDNPFAESERLYFKGVKHTFTQYENLSKLPNDKAHKIPSNKLRKQKVLLDSRNFKDPIKKIQKLKEIEKGYKCCKEPFKSDYQKYWNTGEHCDFTLSLESDSEAFFRLHKVVVGHYSEYFRKIFSEQKLSHFTLKQNNYNSEAVRLLFKWMYFNELPNHEWDEMSFKQAQQTLNCALFTKTWEFLVQVIIKVIIPKMTSEKLIDFLILSEYLPTYFSSRKDDESLSLLFGVLKLLQNYCILYFTNHSIEIIEKTEDVKIQQLIELNSDLIFTLVNETCLKFDTLDHLEKLFGWLNKQAPMYFGRNIVELCSFFESQYLDIQPFDKIYMSFEKEIKSLKSEYAFTTPFFDKTPNLMQETPSKSQKKKTNDGMQDEEDLLHTQIEDILLSKKEWPSSNLLKPTLKEEQAKARDILFSRSSDFTFQFKRPDIPTVFVTEEFLSFSRKWRIIFIIDSGDDQNISVFLRESGQRCQKELEINLYNERILFTSALIRIEFQERKSCSFDMFYSYANKQNISVGRSKFCQAKRIADPQTHNIKVKIWIEELKCHSGLMHFISQKITDYMILGFNEDQKKVAASEVEQSNKKHMVNNEPVSNRRQSHRVMDALLDKEWFKITAQMDEEGKILSPIKSRMSTNRVNKENFTHKAKELNFFSLPVFEAYYILSSDNIQINHEKYAIHLIYRLSLNKSDIEIDLILHGIRFSYLDLDQMLNLARDHTSIKRNKYFQMMIQRELNQRFEMYQDKVVPLQKGRSHYDYAQFYKNQNRKDFKQNFLEWLFNSEHHPGFKSEIQKIQNQIKQQMEELNRKEMEINQQFMKLKQEQLNMKVKPYYPSTQLGQRIQGISTVSTNPSINSNNSSNNSFEDNIQRRVQPSHIQMEPRIIYSQNGQPLLNLSEQEKQRMKGVMDFKQGGMPYISTSKSVEKDNCTIF